MTERFAQTDLVQAIAAVREQLKEAAAQAETDDIQFEVEGLEIEFQIEVRQDDKAKAGARAWVISAGIETGQSKSESNRVKITLKPQTSSGGSVRISDDTDSASKEFPFN
ncbi:trypco2 family protein [Streptomyces sp. N50]|uniref:trypco2 family protein n=1 Tax=Streptomyces sp. N50 TaxID=3081765 RepID=UPI0029623A55|nr:trypco2 family protein [Streptomyces sp. N50]WOX10286.1 trypco2 family protein [Streptomyces sp. N50]